MKRRCLGCMEEIDKDICPYCGFKKGSPSLYKDTLVPGTIFDDIYLVGAVLNITPDLTTYIGYNKKLNKKVFVKEFCPSGYGFEAYTSEAKIRIKYNGYKGFAEIYDNFFAMGKGYIIIECTLGRSLASLIGEKQIPIKKAKEIAISLVDILSGLSLGGARIKALTSQDITLKDGGDILLQNMAPLINQDVSHIPVPERSPLYPAGAILYEMLTGNPVDFNQDKALSPRRLGVNISKELDRAIMDVLSSNPKKWLSDAGEFVEIIKKDTQDIPAAAKPKAPHSKPKREGNGKGVKIAVFAGIAACLIIAVTAGKIVSDKLGGGFDTNTFGIFKSDVNKVPDIKGKTIDEAEEILKKAGVQLEISSVKEGKEYKTGTITDYELKATKNGKKAVPVVVATIALGDNLSDSIGRHYSEIAPKLEKAGYKLDISYEDSNLPSGTIIFYKPGGSSYGSAIELVLARAPKIKLEDIPDVKGLTIDKARTLLHEKGVSIKEENVYDEKVAKNKVVMSTVTQTGDEITALLQVSKGKEIKTVANVTGATANEAQIILKKNGFKVSEKEEYSDIVPLGRVVSYSPSKGEKGDTITLTVSKGKRPVYNLSEYIGWDASVAKANLRDKGISLVEVMEYNSDFWAGSVIRFSQDYASSGDVVTVTVSKGERKVYNLNEYKGWQINNARGDLNSKGIKLIEKSEYNSAYISGRIIRFSKDYASPGDTVTVYYAW